MNPRMVRSGVKESGQHVGGGGTRKRSNVILVRPSPRVGEADGFTAMHKTLVHRLAIGTKRRTLERSSLDPGVRKRRAWPPPYSMFGEKNKLEGGFPIGTVGMTSLGSALAPR